MSALRRCLLRICCRGVDKLHPAGVTGADCDDDAAEPPMIGGGGNAEGDVELSDSSDRCDGRGVDGADGTNGAAVGERTAFARFASSSSRVCAGLPPLGVCGSVGEPARLKLRAKEGGKGGSESCGDSGLRILATDMVRTRPMPATLTRSSSASSRDSWGSESACDEEGAASSTSVSVVAGVSAATGSGAASSSVVSAADVLAVGNKSQMSALPHPELPECRVLTIRLSRLLLAETTKERTESWTLGSARFLRSRLFRRFDRRFGLWLLLWRFGCFALGTPHVGPQLFESPRRSSWRRLCNSGRGLCLDSRGRRRGRYRHDGNRGWNVNWGVGLGG